MDQTRIINEYIKDDLSSESSEESSSDSEHEHEEIKEIQNHHHTFIYNSDRPEVGFREQERLAMSGTERTYYDDRQQQQQQQKQHLNEPSIDFNHSYYGSGGSNNSQKNGIQDYDNQSEENSKTERSDTDKISFMTDRSQPKVSTNSLLNHEIVRSNRITTLMNAVSNSSSQYPVLGNKKSHTFLSTHPISKKSSLSHKLSINSIDSENLEQITVSNNSNSDDTNATENINGSNNGDTPGQSLLKQIEHHQNKQNHKVKGKNSISKSNEHHNHHHHHHHTKHNVSSVSNKDVEDEISNNNSNHLTVAVLKLLHQLEIKFPGKTNEQTKSLLQKVNLTKKKQI